ncbi:hypothetical protein ACMD2_22092, partial [Ananas comosus]
GAPTLERLDRAFISNSWLLAFPRSTLRALPRPRSDHTPLVLAAFTFIPHANLFRFESYWLRHSAVFKVVATAWNSNSFLRDSDLVSLFSQKITSVQSTLRSWSVGLPSASKEQTKLCLLWIQWLDKAEEGRLQLLSSYLTCLRHARDSQSISIKALSRQSTYLLPNQHP